MLEFGLVESTEHLEAEMSACQTAQAVVLPVCTSDSNLRMFSQFIVASMCFQDLRVQMRPRLWLLMTSHLQTLQQRKLMLLTRLSSRVCKNNFFFKEICSFIHCQFLLAGCHYIFFFFTGAASKTSRTVSCFMLYMT